MIQDLYTDKQINILKRIYEDDWFMLVLHGAKRSGKTVLNNDLFLQEVMRAKEQANKDGVDIPMYILAGASLGTIDKNVLTELTNKYGLTFKMDRFNSFMLFGVKIVQVGHSKVSGIDSIRGMTSYGAYINEGSLANPEVFDEIKSRCSGEGARILVDTNTDNPEHWLKKDYIDNPDPMILKYSFSLFDNLRFLGQRYIDNMINSTPTGVFTDRNIHGKWVSGEGAVFIDYSNEYNVIDSLEEYTFVRYFAGVDWGFEHFGVIGVFGMTVDGYVIKIEETSAQHKPQEYWLRVARQYQNRYGYDLPFYCDSARPDLIEYFRTSGVAAKLADKRVMPGIEHMSKIIKNGTFKVLSKGNDLWNKQVYNYAWDKRTGEPVKADDDSVDMTRYAVFSDRTVYKKLKKRSGARDMAAIFGGNHGR